MQAKWQILTRPPSICSGAKGATGYRDTTPRMATTVGSAPPSHKAMEDDGKGEICSIIHSISHPTVSNEVQRDLSSRL